MMGERTGVQETLFYGFSLEQHVPDNHLLRSIDRLIDLSGIRRGNLTEGLYIGLYYEKVCFTQKKF
ncbi:hypothetical protein, partial [Acetobacter cerevisiae]